MASNWPRVSVSDVCELIVDCVNKTAPVSPVPTPYKMIRTPNIKNGRVSTDDCRCVDADTFTKWTRRATVERNDVLLTREAPLGEVGIVNSSEQLFLGQRIMQYRADESRLDPYFLLYSFLSPDLQHQFSMHEGSGSVVSHIRVGDCSKFELNLPPLAMQKRISAILRDLDNKIHLNRQINQTLEHMAHALFKSWFVDFDPVVDNALDAGFFEQNSDLPEELLRRAEQRKIVREQPNFKPLPAETRQLFPVAFEECEEPSLGLGGWVPKGWRRQTLDKIAVLKTESVQPNKLPEVMWEHYSIPAFDAGKKPSNDIGESIKSGKYKIPSDCVLVSKLNPETRRVWLPKVCSDKYAVCSTEFMPFVPFDENYLAFLYCHLSSDNFQTDMCNRVSGTTGSHQRVKPKEVALMSLILPDVELINIFSVIVSPYLSRVQSVVAENDSLTRLRDTLLPKLISGELRLSDDGTLASGNTDC